jgi:4a-hydroxytetrahydrobiopterin dehydratase
VTNALAEKKCLPCRGGTAPLKGRDIAVLLDQLGDGWRAIEEQRIEKEFKFKNFRQALDFTNRVGEIAEAEGHHPDIYLSWGKVRLAIWTHVAAGLTENDFILAAKIDQAVV